MSPVVRRLPVIVKSDDRTEAAGFDFGAEELKSIPVRGDEAFGVVVLSASALGPGSFILLLENICRCLDKGHRVNRFAPDPNLVVKMSASRPA